MTQMSWHLLILCLLFFDQNPWRFRKKNPGAEPWRAPCGTHQPSYLQEEGKKLSAKERWSNGARKILGTKKKYRNFKQQLKNLGLLKVIWHIVPHKPVFEDDFGLFCLANPWNYQYVFWQLEEKITPPPTLLFPFYNSAIDRWFQECCNKVQGYLRWLLFYITWRVFFKSECYRLAGWGHLQPGCSDVLKIPGTLTLMRNSWIVRLFWWLETP